METMSTRAFLAFLIKKAGRQDILDLIRGYEKSGALPEGRYLTGFEMCQYLKKIGAKSKRNYIEIQNPMEDQSSVVDTLWHQYEREVIWPGEKFEEEHPEVTPLTFFETIHSWEDWACEKLGVDVVREFSQR